MSLWHYVQFANRDELYAQLVNCDVIIYDITEHEDQVEEAAWATSRMLSQFVKVFLMWHYYLG